LDYVEIKEARYLIDDRHEEGKLHISAWEENKDQHFKNNLLVKCCLETAVKKVVC
jgi:hypothetical protein